MLCGCLIFRGIAELRQHNFAQQNSGLAELCSFGPLFRKPAHPDGILDSAELTKSDGSLAAIVCSAALQRHIMTQCIVPSVLLYQLHKLQKMKYQAAQNF